MKSKSKSKPNLNRAETACYRYLPLDEHENLMAVVMSTVRRAFLCGTIVGALLAFIATSCVFVFLV